MFSYLQRGVQNLFSLDSTSFETQWNLDKVASLGLSSNISSVAYDDSQGYFAIGCENGRVLLISNGFERWLPTSSEVGTSSIVQLLFRRGDSILYGVQAGQLLTWSLTDYKCISMSFPDPVMKIDLNSCSPWLAIAFKSGLVKLMDCNSARMSTYLIPIDIGNGQNLTDIQLNPLDFNLILLGYDTECVLWNFEEKMAQERFTLFDKTSSKESISSSPASLKNVCWSPNGFEFVTSYDSGAVAVWSVKKNLLQGLGLSKKKKHIHLYQTGCSIDRLEWIEATYSSSFLFISHSTKAEVTRLEIVKDKHGKATVSLNCKDIVRCLMAIYIHHTCILLTISQSGHLEFHYPSESSQFEIPATLHNAMNGSHSISTVCDDGFLLINSIKQTKLKNTLMVQGGSIFPKNTTRNYHVLIIFRNGNLEFWHLSIPFPSFLCNVPVNHLQDLGAAPDLSDLSIRADLKERVLILQTTSKIVIFDFIQHNVDVDDIMDKLDSTMAALEIDRSAIRNLSQNDTFERESEYGGANEEDISEEDEKEYEEERAVDVNVNGAVGVEPKNIPLEMNDAAIWSNSSSYHSRPGSSQPFSAKPAFNDVVPTPQSIPSHEIKCSKTPPMYIADAQWTTSVSIDAQCVIASYAFSSQTRCVLLATSSTFSLVSVDEGRSVFQKYVQEYLERPPSYVKSLPCITFVRFCMIDEHRSFLILTTQSIILFRIMPERGRLSAIPLFVSHCEQEFGMVLKVEGLRDFKLCMLEYESWDWFVVFTTTSVLVFKVSSSGHEMLTELNNRRDFDVSIANGGLVQILETSYIVLVTEEDILVLGIASLNILYRKSFSGLEISKLHLSESFICKTGIVGFWNQNNQWNLYRLNENIQIPSFDIKVFDATKAKRYAEVHGLSIGKRNNTADQLFAPEVIPSSGTEATGLAGDLARAGQALVERGEKLNELADRSGELANASSSFANSMKQIRQAQEKRWGI